MMKEDDYSLFLWVEWLDICRRYWKYWEDVIDTFFVMKQKED